MGGQIAADGSAMATSRGVCAERPARSARQFDFPPMGAVAGPGPPGESQRGGRGRAVRQRLGMDVDDLRAVTRIRAVSVLSGLLRELLRRPALRAQRWFAAHGGMHAETEFSQLVPGALPVCVCGISLRAGLAI